MRIVSIIHSAGHEMPMLVDRDGLPISDPNEWLFGRRSLAPTTQSRILSELVPLYSWAECRGIDIRQRIESGQGFIEAEVISGLVEALGEGNVYLHGLPYAMAPDTQIKVPMVAWLSPGMASSSRISLDCVRAKATKPISHDNLFHSVLGLMQVSTEIYDAGLDVFYGCQAAAGAQ